MAYGDQWCSLVAVVWNNSTTRTKTVLGAETGYGSSDIISCSVMKDIGEPCGGFTLTLVPDENYFDIIKRNDWIEIYGSVGDGRGYRRLMLGLVDRIGYESSHGPNGEPYRTIGINGRDWGKALLATRPVFDPYLKGTFDPFDRILSSWAKGQFANRLKPGTILQFLLQTLLGPAAKQFSLPSGFPLASAIDMSAIEAGRGFVIFEKNFSIGENVWSSLQTFAVPIFNEMYTDWDSTPTVKVIDSMGLPKMAFREFRFSRADFAALPGLSVVGEDVITESVGCNDSQVQNFFRIHQDTFDDPATAARIGYVVPESVRVNGFRPYEPVTNGLFSGALDEYNSDEDFLREATLKVAEWHWQNENLRNGSLTCRFMPDAKIGTRVDYSRNATKAWSYYCEGVSHHFQFGEQPRTTTQLLLTRGVDVSLKELRSADELVADGTLVPLDTFDPLAPG